MKVSLEADIDKRGKANGHDAIKKIHDGITLSKNICDDYLPIPSYLCQEFPMQALLTTSDVINALGTNRDVADLFSVKYNTVTNWRTFGHFPPDTYVMIQDALAELGLIAPDYLWKMRTRATPRRQNTVKKKPRTNRC